MIPVHCIVERVSGSESCAAHAPATVATGGETSSPTAGGANLLSTASGSAALLMPAVSSSVASLNAVTGSSMSTSSLGPTPPLLTPISVPLLSANITCNSSPSPSGGRITSPPPVIVEQDSYAIIPAGVLFVDLVRTALLRLGYTASEAVGAKGFIQLSNWKPLKLDQITDSTDATVADVLSDLSHVVTLHIRLYRPRTNAAHELKDKLLQILLANSYTLLVNSGCPIDQHLLTSLCRGRSGEYEIPDDTRVKFDEWYLQQIFNHYRNIATIAAAQQQMSEVVQAANGSTALRPHSPTKSNHHSPTLSGPTAVNGRRNNSLAAEHGDQLQLNHADQQASHLLNNASATSPSSHHHPPAHHHHHHAMPSHHGQPPQPAPHPVSQQYVRTRIRTSFDPELELPKLHKWFQENQHPSRPQIQLYVKELNALESRKGRKPLDVNNVVYWFKNARAAHKRQELKFVNGGASPPPASGRTGGDAGGKSAGNRNDANNNRESVNGGLVGQERSDASATEDDADNHEDDMDSNDEAMASEPDDEMPAFSQTLDLSMRPAKRVKCETASSSSPPNRVRSSDTPPYHDGHSLSDEEEEEDSDEMEEYVTADDLASGHAGGNAVNGGIFFTGKSSNFNSASYHPHGSGNGGLPVAGTSGIGAASAAGSEDSSPDGKRMRRSRTFIDPMTEVPRLEHWFAVNTHPTHSQIVRYTDDLNGLPYRQKFPKLEPKNIQFWFKNRRAKYKRLSLPTQVTPSSSSGSCPSGAVGSATSPIAGNTGNCYSNLPTSTPSPTGAGSLPAGGGPSASQSAMNVERLVGH